MSRRVGATVASVSSRPNILWIVTTQWRGQALGFAGDPNAVTPALDRLAARGVAATGLTPHPFGPFARAALLTGVLSPANGIAHYFDPLPGTAKTVAHELAAEGYRTAFFGKWHLSARDPAAPLVGEAHARAIVPPAGRGGFELWEGFESGFLLNDPWLHGTRLPVPTRFSGYQSNVLCERAAAWCGEPAPTPWFCVVSLEAPHPPYAAESAGVVPRDPASLQLAANVPRGGEVEARVRRELAGYQAHIAATDRAVGHLIEAAAGTNTAIVVTSVHGDMHGAHGLFRKGWPYEESVRVPMVFAAPAGISLPEPAEIVSLVDLGRWAGAWVRGGERPPRRSLGEISMPAVVDLAHQCDRTWRGLRTATRKLVLNDDETPWLFFDLERDPLEMRNLATEPAFTSEMEALRRELLRNGQSIASARSVSD